jgi:hypothetical protein
VAGHERQRAPVERQLVDARRRGQERRHQRDQPGGQPRAERSAYRGDEKALADDGADHAGARCAERGADGELAPAPMHLDEREAGNVGDRDDPERGDRAEDQHEAAARVADADLLECAYFGGPSRVRLGEFPCQDLLDRGQLARSRFETDARPQPSDAPHEARVAHPHQAGWGLSREPDVRGRAGEDPGHDTDDLIRTTTNKEGASDGRSVAIEAARPEALADHGRAGAVRLFLCVGERAAGKRRHPVDAEETWSDTTPLQALGLRATRVCDVFRITPRQRAETSVEPVPLFEPARCDEARLLPRRRTGFVDRDEAISVRVGKGLEQHRVYEREDSRGDTGTETQGHDRSGEIRGPAPQRAPRLPPGRCPQPLAERRAKRSGGPVHTLDLEVLSRLDVTGSRRLANEESAVSTDERRRSGTPPARGRPGS